MGLIWRRSEEGGVGGVGAKGIWARSNNGFRVGENKIAIHLVNNGTGKIAG